VPTVLFMRSRAAFGRTSRLDRHKGARFVGALGDCWLFCYVDRTNLVVVQISRVDVHVIPDADSARDRRPATVLITVPTQTLANSALFISLFTYVMHSAVLVITQLPRIGQRTQQPERPQGSGGLCELVGLTV
jgi:hypothetical protein